MAESAELYYAKMSQVSAIIGKLSQTSQFMVNLNLAANSTGVNGHLASCGLLTNPKSYDFLCSDVTLPGSSFDMSEESGSRQGVIERFATRRIYTDFDLTFYVDDNYNSLRLLEEWMNYIDPINSSAGAYQGSSGGQTGFNDSNNFYRMKYPNHYKRSISVVKFERNFLANPSVSNSDFRSQPLLKYTFIDAFPMNIVAIPFSYESSTITKVTASFNYTRYIVEKTNFTVTSNTITNTSNPDQPEISPTPNSQPGRTGSTISNDLAIWALSNQSMIEKQTVSRSGNYLSDQKNILAQAISQFPPGSAQRKELLSKAQTYNPNVSF